MNRFLVILLACGLSFPAFAYNSQITTITTVTGTQALTAGMGQVQIAQTAAGSYTLPQAPADGTRLEIVDALGNFPTYNATINPGAGDTILTSATPLVLRNPFETMVLTYHTNTHNWVAS